MYSVLRNRDYTGSADDYQLSGFQVGDPNVAPEDPPVREIIPGFSVGGRVHRETSFPLESLPYYEHVHQTGMMLDGEFRHTQASFTDPNLMAMLLPQAIKEDVEETTILQPRLELEQMVQKHITGLLADQTAMDKLKQQAYDLRTGTEYEKRKFLEQLVEKQLFMGNAPQYEAQQRALAKYFGIPFTPPAGTPSGGTPSGGTPALSTVTPGTPALSSFGPSPPGSGFITPGSGYARAPSGDGTPDLSSGGITPQIEDVPEFWPGFPAGREEEARAAAQALVGRLIGGIRDSASSQTMAQAASDPQTAEVMREAAQAHRGDGSVIQQIASAQQEPVALPPSEPSTSKTPPSEPSTSKTPPTMNDILKELKSSVEPGTSKLGTIKIGTVVKNQNGAYVYVKSLTPLKGIPIKTYVAERLAGRDPTKLDGVKISKAAPASNADISKNVRGVFFPTKTSDLTQGLIGDYQKDDITRRMTGLLQPGMVVFDNKRQRAVVVAPDVTQAVGLESFIQSRSLGLNPFRSTTAITDPTSMTKSSVDSLIAEYTKKYGAQS